MYTTAFGSVRLCTNPVSVGPSTDSTTLAFTLLDGRSLTPATGVLPTTPRPALCFCHSCLFDSLPPDIGLVGFHRTRKRFHVGIVPAFADTMRHVPSGPLGNAYVSVEFHGRHAFEVGSQKVYRHRPLLIAHLRGVHDRVGLDREETPAVGAVVGLGRVVALSSHAARCRSGRIELRPASGLRQTTARRFRRLGTSASVPEGRCPCGTLCLGRSWDASRLDYPLIIPKRRSGVSRAFRGIPPPVYFAI